MSIRIVVPGIPPSVNHYVKHTRAGRHYKSEEAKNWEELVGYYALSNRSETIEADKVSIWVHLGKGQRGDVDNFPKSVLDSLVRARIIRSDATITHLEVRKSRVAVGALPFTEIEIT